jgi:hypothetical protein
VNIPVLDGLMNEVGTLNPDPYSPSEGTVAVQAFGATDGFVLVDLYENGQGRVSILSLDEMGAAWRETWEALQHFWGLPCDGIAEEVSNLFVERVARQPN